MEPLDQPVEETHRADRQRSPGHASPAIAAGGFDEFGISFQVPGGRCAGDEILFPDRPDVLGAARSVEWIEEDEEAESPAPRITVIAAEEEEEAAAPAATSTEEAAPVPAASSDDDDDNMATVAIAFGIAGLVAGLVALGITLFRKPKAATN